MKRIELNDYPKDSIRVLLSGIPFFKEVSNLDSDQLKLLLKNSWLQEFTPGEEVIRRGTRDNVYYFILRGNLTVYPDDKDVHHRIVNHLGTGHVFGALSLLTNRPRTASLVSDKNGQSTLLFCTDFGVFGELADFSQVSLETKLCFYRLVVNHTRWKLELYRMEHSQHPLADKVKDVTLFVGQKGTQEELASLNSQASELADLLENWNDAFRSPGQFQITDDGLEMLNLIHSA